MNIKSIDPIILGALYDLMGYLTSRDKVLVMGASQDASPAAEALGDWAELRSLGNSDACVLDWRNKRDTVNGLMTGASPVLFFGGELGASAIDALMSAGPGEFSFLSPGDAYAGPDVQETSARDADMERTENTRRHHEATVVLNELGWSWGGGGWIAPLPKTFYRMTDDEREKFGTKRFQAGYEAGHKDGNEGTRAWAAVCEKLEQVAPGWLTKEGTGIQCAIKAIDQLASRRAVLPWSRWDGGDCPVAPTAPTAAILRNGTICGTRPAELFRWGHSDERSSDFECDIIAYRLA